MDAKTYLAKQRRKTVLRLRFAYGINHLSERPWLIAPLLMIIALCIAAWCNRKSVLFTSPMPYLSEIWAYTVDALILTIAFIVIALFIVWVGTPRHAKRIEADLENAEILDFNNQPPVLVSEQQIKGTKACTLTLYSKGIELSKYIKSKKTIESSLNMHYVVPPVYAGRFDKMGTLITLTVAPGVVETEKEVVVDDIDAV